MAQPTPVQIMKPSRYVYVFILLTVLQNASAHDPGLSLLDVQFNPDQITMRYTLAQADLESLITLDLNDDQLVSQDELDNADQSLNSIFGKSVQIQIGEDVSNPSRILFESAPSQAINVWLIFDAITQQNPELSIPLIRRFPRGHRLHLAVHDASNQLTDQQILSAKSPPVKLQTGIVSSTSIFQHYVQEGVWHIWIGFDHILFLVTLLLPAVLIHRHSTWQHVQRWQPVLRDMLAIVTTFTIAHSITLSLAALNIVSIQSAIIEPVIALSVLVTSLNNLYPLLHQARWVLAFGFGLIHGFGFASVLSDLGLQQQSLISSLLGFNLGVEAGQLAIVAVFIPLAYLMRHTVIYRQVIFKGGSLTAAVIACLWMLERIAGVELNQLSDLIAFS